MNEQRAMKTISTLPGVVSILALLIGGCAVGPDFKEPDPNMPAGWLGVGGAASTQPSVANMSPVQVVDWWRGFNDPTLNTLIYRAMQSNLDLRLATSRIRQARAVTGTVTPGLFPRVDVSGSYSRTGSAAISNGRDLFRAGFDAAWELDVFGGIRRDVEATTADVQAAIEDRRDVQVTLLSEVATNYIQLRSYQRQIAIAKQNLDLQTHSASVTHDRIKAGPGAPLDAIQADAQVATTAAQIPALESLSQQTIYTLSLLLGQQPAALADQLATATPIPASPPSIPVGLPSDLLRRRPDIRRAEAQLHAATARIGVATADLFPKFSLTGSLGLEGSKSASLSSWNDRFWSFGPSVSWPIFDAGRIRSQIEIQNAAQEQAAILYENAVLTALHDVESALIAYSKEQLHRETLITSVTLNRKAVDLATGLFKNGFTNFLNVLDAQRSLLGSQDALVQSERAVATNLVSLYKALGGGWDDAAILQPTTMSTVK